MQCFNFERREGQGTCGVKGTGMGQNIVDNQNEEYTDGCTEYISDGNV